LLLLLGLHGCGLFTCVAELGAESSPPVTPQNAPASRTPDAIAADGVDVRQRLSRSREET
jgi:hypothetical protein